MVALPDENVADAPATFESQPENKVKVKSEDEPDGSNAAVAEELPAPDLDPLAPRTLPPPLSPEEAEAPATEAVDTPPQLRDGELYLLQFPTPFPGFVLPPKKQDSDMAQDKDKDKERRVAFRADTAGGAGSPGGPSATTSAAAPVSAAGAKTGPPDGRMGTLKYYPDGRVRMVLGHSRRGHAAGSGTSSGTGPGSVSGLKGKVARPRDNVVAMDVHRGSSSTFLEQAMLLDANALGGAATCLGSIRGKFVLTPDLDAIDSQP